MSNAVDNRSGNVNRWQRHDMLLDATETLVNEHKPVVAEQGIALAEEIQLDSFDPTQSSHEIWSAPTSKGFRQFGGHFAAKTPLTQQGKMGEAIAVVQKPVTIMNNLMDAGLHGVAAGIQALQD